MNSAIQDPGPFGQTCLLWEVWYELEGVPLLGVRQKPADFGV